MEANVCQDEAYLRSLNIPYFNCDREETEQLQMHFLCSLLCCPKQIESDETVRAELVNINMREVTNCDMDLYVVGRIATRDDKEELERIERNLERVFQLPLFEKFVGLDDNAKFKLHPPERILPLYERIRIGGQYVRHKEGTADARKQKECNTPQAVYRCKVVCNFLMELIEREKRHQKTKGFVDWQSVQRRYSEMCTDKDSEDRSLMEEYISKYRMPFPQNILNSDVIKTWTGRSTITKALSMPVFSKIILKVEVTTGSLRVNFGDSTTLYSDEEMKKACQAMLEEKEHKDKGSGKEQRRRKEPAEPECTPEELASIVPLRQRQPQNITAPIIPDPAFSPFSVPLAVEVKKPTSEWTDVRPAETEVPVNMNEPQYIPEYASDVESSNAYSDSDDNGHISGVYTDEEELEEASQATKVQEKSVEPSIPHPKPEQPSITRAEPTRVADRPEPRVYRDESRSSFNPKPSHTVHEEVRRPEETVKSFANPWEVSYQEEPTLREKSDPKQENPPLARQADVGPTATSFSTAEILPPSPTQSRHASAFASCRTPNVAKKDSDSGRSIGRTTANVETEKETVRSGLYERKSNIRIQQEHAYGKSSASNIGDSRLDRERGADKRPSPSIEQPRTADFDDSSSTSQSRSRFKPIQQPLGTAPQTSVFARPIATSCVRTRTPVRNDSYRPREPPRSYTALGGREYDGSAHNRNYDAYQQPNKRNNDESYDRKELSRDRGHTYEDQNRPRSSASRYDSANGKYGDTYTESRRDNSRYRGDYREEKYANDTSTYYGRNQPRTYPRDEYDSRGSFEEGNRNHNHDSNNRPYDNYQNASERDNSAYRQRDYSTRTSNVDTSYAQSHRGRDPLDNYSEGYRRDSNERTAYESSATRQGQRRNSPRPVLTADERARLRIVRDFTFLYRDKSHGYQTLGNLFKILPVDSSVDWESLIRTYLPQVELIDFRDSHLLSWKEGSNPEDDRSSI